MWRARQYSLLHDEIKTILSTLTGAAELKTLVKESLDLNWEIILRKINQKHPWPLLPLLVCESISGRYDQALPAASALYLLKISAEIFDDIEDADSPESIPAKYGVAKAVNLASTFMVLAEKSITCLAAKDIGPETIIRIFDIVNSAYINACAGQYLDLSPDLKMTLSEDYYLHIIEMKSASISKCACHTGALLATTDAKLVKKFTNFGYNLGMASQIANDILGVTGGKDILTHKITLPVIFALDHAKTGIRRQLEKIYLKKNQIRDSSQIKDLLFTSGGVQYAMIKMEDYKQQAGEILSDIENRLMNVKKLKIFLG